MIHIRQEKKDDWQQITEVVRLAFESEEYSDGDEHHLVERLRESDEFIPELSLVAEIDGQVVGHILFTEIKIGEATALALAPVSVLPEYQSKGIGGKLIVRGHEIARALGYPAVVLLGHETYYPRFGYKIASEYGIKAPFEVPDENFMVLELQEGALKSIGGIVIYSKAFMINQ